MIKPLHPPNTVHVWLALNWAASPDLSSITCVCVLMPVCLRFFIHRGYADILSAYICNNILYFHTCWQIWLCVEFLELLVIKILFFEYKSAASCFLEYVIYENCLYLNFFLVFILLWYIQFYSLMHYIQTTASLPSLLPVLLLLLLYSLRTSQVIYDSVTFTNVWKLQVSPLIWLCLCVFSPVSCLVR